MQNENAWKRIRVSAYQRDIALQARHTVETTGNVSVGTMIRKAPEVWIRPTGQDYGFEAIIFPDFTGTPASEARTIEFKDRIDEAIKKGCIIDDAHRAFSAKHIYEKFSSPVHGLV